MRTSLTVRKMIATNRISAIET